MDKLGAIARSLSDVGIAGEPLALIMTWVRMHACKEALASNGILPADASGATPTSQPISIGEAARIFHRNSLRTGALVGTELDAPAWNMLLALFAETMAGNRFSVSAACRASGGPPSTALRYLSRLVDDGLVVRNLDPCDARRVFVAIAPDKVDHLARIIKGFCLAEPLNVAGY